MSANPEPDLTAVVRADGTGEITIDGERSPVYAGSVADIRATIIGRASVIAEQRGEAVTIAITDLDGLYPLRVDARGKVETYGDIVPLDQIADATPHAGAAASVGDAAGSDAEPESEVKAEDTEPEAAVDSPEQTETGPRAAVIPPPPNGVAIFDAAFDAAPAPTPVRAAGSPADRRDDRSISGSSTPDQHVPHAYFRRSVEMEADSSSQPPASARPKNDAQEAPAPAAPTVEAPAKDAPTLDDFLQSRPDAPVGPAKHGWQGMIRRATGGLISPRPGKSELAHRSAVERVQRSLKGPRTIVVLNPKGGAHKTTATLLLAATFGIHRGGSTLAWDNNETRGTLGWRAQPSRHTNTAVDLLRDLDRFSDVRSARVGDLDNYVRAQGDAQFDVLASDEDAAASSTIDRAAFRSLHSTLSRFYRVLVIDTGNNMRASNWEAAVEAADQLVVVTTVNEETAASAAWLLDGLRQKGHQDKVAQAVTILSSPGDAVQPELSRRLHNHFAALTRVVLEVPYDPGFQSGGPLNVDVLSPKTREAWLQVSAAVADGL
jgi:MinD-like ATPase involved in chromosome partitioning or flagellar assembly